MTSWRSSRLGSKSNLVFLKYRPYFLLYSAPEKCKKLSTLKPIISSEIWSASNLDEEYTPTIGTTIDLVCPEGLKLSHENDGFNPFDDKFTILCTTRTTFDIPKEISAWPTCVKVHKQDCKHVIVLNSLHLLVKL